MHVYMQRMSQVASKKSGKPFKFSSRKVHVIQGKVLLPSVLLSFLFCKHSNANINLFPEFANYFFTFSNESSNKIIRNLKSLYALSHIITTKTTVSRITAEAVGSVLPSAKEKKKSTTKEKNL